jgi:serine/threonine protein kinase
METARASLRNTRIDPLRPTHTPDPASEVRKASASFFSQDKLPGMNGTYTLLRPVGTGGMSMVCLGEHEATGTKVAIKLALKDTHDIFIEREYYALAAVTHPNVLRVYDAGRAKGRSFLVTEMLEGSDLHSFVGHGKPLDIDVALTIAAQALEGLEAIHEAGIVHGDLKPSNLFIADSGDSADVKIIDFGLAKSHGEASTPAAPFGTVGFMAPEQAMGTGVDHRADIYAIGVILYNMVSGIRPFIGETQDIMSQTVSCVPFLPSMFNTGIPPMVEAIVMRSLEKDPEKRFRNATQFREQLENALDAMC